MSRYGSSEAAVAGRTSAETFAHAQAVIPGGVNSPVRAFGAVGGTPPFVASGSGPYVTDVDGHEYVDLVGSWGPALLGHAHPDVVEAVQAAAARGLGFGAPTVTEVDLVDEIRSRVPAAETPAESGRPSVATPDPAEASRASTCPW